MVGNCIVLVLANFATHANKNYPFVVIATVWFSALDAPINGLILELATEYTFPYGNGRICGMVELIDNIFAAVLASLADPVTGLFMDLEAHLKPDYNATFYPKNECFNEDNGVTFRKYDYKIFFFIFVGVGFLLHVVSRIFYQHVNYRKEMVDDVARRR